MYCFNKMAGKGKVQSFTTAGEEHLRREEMFKQKSEFKKSESFLKALHAGLEKLSTDKGPDSSSPYSREEHRLFLSWLPEQDRRFPEESEGSETHRKRRSHGWRGFEGLSTCRKGGRGTRRVAKLDRSSNTWGVNFVKQHPF